MGRKPCLLSSVARVRRRLRAPKAALILVLIFQPALLRDVLLNFLTFAQQLFSALSLLPSPSDVSDRRCARKSTIVTAYYGLTESKHGLKSFHSWNLRFFALSDAMVIFTDSKSLDVIKQLRARSLYAACTVYHTEEIVSVFAANLTDWKHQFILDWEREVHKREELYIIWNQKSDWLLRAAKLNIFHSKYFFWADSGQFRDRVFYRTLFGAGMHWIRRDDIPDDKILALAILEFRPCQLQLMNGKSPIIDPLSVTIGGGNFGGTLQAIERWHKLYYAKLVDVINTGTFAGKDQPIMAAVCIENPALCHLVSSSEVKGARNSWFAMQPLLHGSSKMPIYVYHPTDNAITNCHNVYA